MQAVLAAALLRGVSPRQIALARPILPGRRTAEGQAH